MSDDLFEVFGIKPPKGAGPQVAEDDLFEIAGIKMEPRKAASRTWGEAGADTAVQLAEGVNNIAGAVPNLVAPASGVAKFFRDNADHWRKKQSEPMQKKIAQADAQIATADQDSIVAQAVEAAKAYSSDPVLAARFVVTNLPSMIPGIGAAKLAQAAKLATGASAAAAAGAATTAAGVTNAALNAGGARGEAFEDIRDALLAQGRSPQEAEQIALEKSLLPAAVGAATGFLSGKTGLERAVVGKGVATGGARAAARSGLIELGGEQLEEVLPKVATNYEAGDIDKRPLSRDVGRTAVETAIASGPGAVVSGGIEGLREREAPKATSRAVAPAAAQTAPEAAPIPAQNSAPAQATQGQPAINSEDSQVLVAQQPDGAPDAMDDRTAAVRLAELEVIDSGVGLNDAQQAERAALAARVEAEALREAELENIGESAEGDTGNPVSAPSLARSEQVAIESGAPEFDPGAVQAKTWPQFVAERGEKVSTLRRGTPAWDALQNEWAAVKTKRAGVNPEGTGAVGAPTPEIQNRDRSRPASVVQMQGMAQNPDYMRLGVSRSPETGAPMVFAVGDRVEAAQAIGRADTAVMSDGQRVPFQYAVMEAADVQPSNFADGNPNPLFDAGHPGTVKALNNGRTAGLRAAYERGTAEGYKQELMADSTMHGIDAELIAAMKAPVLVRLYSERDNQSNMGAKSQSQALGLSATEQAATDAALVDGAVLDVFDSGDLGSAGNRDFARAFIGKLQAEGQDVAGMLDASGALSPAGVTRLQAALVHKAYSDGDLVESMFGSTDTDIRAIGEALKAVAGEWANMRNAAELGAINPQVDVTGNLLQAIRLVQKARRERASLYDAINQVDMVTGDVVDPITVGMLRMLYSGEYMTRAMGRDSVVESLRTYMGAALATRADGDMFGEQVGPDAILSALSGQPTTQTSNATSTEPARQSAPEPAQGERGAAGSYPAGRRADEPGRQEQRPQPDKAGPDSAAAGRGGQGQDASHQRGQPDRPGDKGASEDRSGAVAGEIDVYHGTKAGVPVEQLSLTRDLGPHFTTSLETAKLFADDEGRSGQVLHAKARFSNPLELTDMDSWFPADVAAAVDEVHGVPADAEGQTPLQSEVWAAMEKARIAELEAQSSASDAMEASSNAGYSALRESLQRKGYDAIKYVNRSEGAPVDTYIALDMGKVRSAPALELDRYSPEEITQRDAAQQQADQTRSRADAKADADARAERERKEVAERMDASADNFELGQDADDSLSGQKPMFSRAPSIETKAFKDWFSGSKVTDAEGKPLVMYHGSGSDFSIYEQGKGKGAGGRSARLGFFFTASPVVASSYAEQTPEFERTRGYERVERLERSGKYDEAEALSESLEVDDFMGGMAPNVQPVYLAIKNPMLVDFEGRSYDPEKDNLTGIIRDAKESGHDGVMFRNIDDAPVLGLAPADQFVAFEPEQIKSATGNRGTFDPSNPDIRFSFAGQTARTADLAELQRAKGMAERGVSSAAIQQHTGWHRGVDGRWRFEVSDDEAAFRQSAADESAVREIEKLVRDSATVAHDGDLFRAVVGDGTDGVMTGYGSTRDDALQRLADRVARSRFGTDFDIAKVEDRSAYPLPDVLNHPDLLAAYPFLRGFTVYFRKGSEGGVRGSFDERNQAITLDSSRKPEEMLSTLLHELQHAIQAREDFARGGNANADFSKSVKNVLRDMADTEARAVEAWKSRHPELMASADKTAAAVRDALKYESMERLLSYSERDKPSGVFRLIRNEMQWIYEHESWRDPVAFELQRRFYGMPKSGPKRNAFIRDLAFDAQQWLRGSIAAENLAAFKSDERTTKGMIAALRRQAEKARVKLKPLREQERRALVAEALERQSQSKSAFDIYRSLAGEVEARATQARQQLTPEERRARPVEMDMDVPPSEAIVVVGGQEMLVPETQLSADAPSAGAFDVGSFLGVMQPSDETRSQATSKAQALVDRMTADWANAPKVVVAFDMADPKVPAEVRLDFNAQQSRGAEGTADGFFYGGKVYLLASQLPAENDLRRVLFHESLGHYGLRGVFGDALKPILQQVVQARRQEVNAKAAQYGLDMRKEADRLMAAEEVLAELAEKSPELGFVRRAVAAVRAFLRSRFKRFENLNVSDGEIIQQYILPARGWVERGRAPAESGRGTQSFEPAFSIQDMGGKALEELSKASDLFALPKSDKDTLAGIAAEHPGGIAVGSPRSIAGRVEYTLTTLSGKTATVSVREPNPFGESVYDMKYTDEGMEAVAGRPGENPEDVAPTADVWIDVSDLSPGQADGAAIYNIAATYAHNTGRIFIGDPHGLSKEALRRRLEQMLSSALKFGTTRHLAPHPDQVKGGNGVPGLRWVYGDDVGNVERMIAASVQALDNGFPSSKLIAYDPARGFYRTDTGSAVARGQLAAALGRATAQRRMAHGAGSTGQAGWRTVARAALFRYLQQAVDADAGAGRGRLLDRLSEERARVEGDGPGEAPGGSAINADQRIFYSRQPGVAAGAPAPKGRLAQLQDRVRSLTSRESVDTWLYNWQDRFIDLKRIQEQIKALNGTVSETNDAYRGEELYHKRVAKRTSNFLRDEVRPLLKAMNDAKVEMPEFERFLHARHAPEANRVMAERNPNQEQLDQKRTDADKAVRDLRLQLQRASAAGTSTVALQKSLGLAMIEADKWSGAEAFRGTEEERLSLSGMSDAEANKILTGYAPEMRKALDDLAGRVDKINNGTLKTLEQYGLMDTATLATWSKTYQHYVPLHRDEANPGSKAHPIGQGFSTKGDASKQRTGSNQKVTHILSHIVMQREAALTRGEKNNVVKRLYLLAAQNPDDNIWSLDMPKKKAVDPDTGLVKTIPDQGAKLRDNVVTLRVGGKDKHIVFNEKNERAVRLALAVKNMDATELDRFTRTMGVLTRWFAAVNTQYNPVFGVMNLARDLQGSMLQLSSTPLAGKQGEVFKNIRSNMGSIYKDLRRERKEAGAGQGPWAKLWEEMQLDGGTTGYRDLYGKPEDRAKALQKALDRNTEGAAMGAARGMLEWLSDFNETLEATTRLATYKAALDNGMSREGAASLAKNITVNFNRKGRNTSVVGSYYAFLNAAIQGNKRMLETLSGPAGRKIMLGGVALGMMSGMAGSLIMGGGGADDEWKKIPEFVKERSIIIPLSRQDYVSIPMPLGFHVFPNIGRKLVEFGMHDDPTKNRAGHLLDMGLIALNAYNPLGGADNIMQMLAPTPFDPVVALMENKDWTGREIYKEQRSALDPKPGHAMAKDSTLPPARWVARVVNDATGGNEWQPGKWSPNPDAIEYLFGQFTGGVGRELSKVGKMATSAATGEELAPHQLTLVGRIYGNTRGVNGQSTGYYDNLKRINTSMNEAKGRQQQGEDVDVILADVPLASLDGPANQLDKKVSDLVKQRRSIQKSDMPNKRELVKEVNKEIEASMYLLNSAVENTLSAARRK